ncbi:MAG: glycosyltransferase family 87 protein [Roseiarcus sp.]|jgi:hypothetical protein
MAQSMTRESRARARSLTPGGAAKLPLGPHTLLILFIAASLILAAIPLAPELFGAGKGDDYALWYWAGRQVLTGGDLYAVDGRTTFPFLYPPLAAVLMAPFSLFGPAFSVLCIVLVNLASWWVAVTLSDRLSGDKGPRAWWVVALPSLLSAFVVAETFNFGQANLLLLALMLAGLALLQSERPWSAGAMFALAASLKAFPVAILPYLLWRRRWRAAAAMVIGVGVLLLIVPAPFRGFERNLQEVRTWSEGMVLSANQDGFGQRLDENWSWKNQSIVAVTHRFLRPLNAEVIGRDVKPIYVNILSLGYQQANLVLLAIAGLIGVGFCAVLPPERGRTLRSDAEEFALLLSLMTIASPLARTYYFVWLLFPVTVLVYRAALEPRARVRRATWGLLTLALALATVPFLGHSHWPQALGNLFWATAIIAGALAWRLRLGVASASATAVEGGDPALLGVAPP